MIQPLCRLMVPGRKRRPRPVTPKPKNRPRLGLGLALLLALAQAGAAATTTTSAGPSTRPARVAWSARDVAGKAFEVPVADRVSVVLFVMAEQSHSQAAAKQVQEALAARAGTQAVAVVSGQDAAAKAGAFAQAAKWTGPVVADPEYAASGKMTVRVWPTTVVVDAAGLEVAHLGGCPQSYRKDLEAYLDFAAGAIDQAALKTRLSESHVVSSSPADVAARHLHVAQRLLAAHQIKEARAELDRGLKIQPDDAALLLELARLHVAAGTPDQALATLERIAKDQLAPWRLQAVRGRALLALGKPDQALAALTEALKLNPDPAEVHYALGQVHEQKGDWRKAAEAYRAAFEHTLAGKSLRPETPR